MSQQERRVYGRLSMIMEHFVRSVFLSTVNNSLTQHVAQQFSENVERALLISVQ